MLPAYTQYESRENLNVMCVLRPTNKGHDKQVTIKVILKKHPLGFVNENTEAALGWSSAGKSWRE